MNAANVVAVLFATVFLRDSFANQLIFHSDPPLPASLQKAIEREISLAGMRGQDQADLYIEIHGACRVSNQSLPGADRPLGWVDRVDGDMLSIIHVDCARIGQALWRIVADPQSPETRELMARAMVRVIRHERRHLILRTVNHEKTGDFKPSLRAEELIAPFSTALSN